VLYITKASEIHPFLISRAKPPISKIEKLTQSNQTISRSVILFQGKTFLRFTALSPSLTILEFWTKVVPSIRKNIKKKEGSYQETSKVARVWDCQQ
jgi:hypothetical protein